MTPAHLGAGCARRRGEPRLRIVWLARWAPSVVGSAKGDVRSTTDAPRDPMPPRPAPHGDGQWWDRLLAGRGQPAARGVEPEGRGDVSRRQRLRAPTAHQRIVLSSALVAAGAGDGPDHRLSGGQGGLKGGVNGRTGPVRRFTSPRPGPRFASAENSTSTLPQESPFAPDLGSCAQNRCPPISSRSQSAPKLTFARPSRASWRTCDGVTAASRLPARQGPVEGAQAGQGTQDGAAKAAPSVHPARASPTPLATTIIRGKAAHAEAGAAAPTAAGAACSAADQPERPRFVQDCVQRARRPDGERTARVRGLSRRAIPPGVRSTRPRWPPSCWRCMS